MHQVRVLLLFCFFSASSFAQKDTVAFLEPDVNFNLKRTRTVVLTSAVAGAGVLGVLSYTWYKDFNTQSFHFFDDGIEWRGMDKIGHGVTSFYICEFANQLYRW